MITNDRRRIICICILALEILTFLVMFLCNLCKHQVTNMTEFTSDMFSVAEEYNGDLEVYGGTGSIDSAHTGKNRRIISPEITLERGIYQVDVFYDSTTPSGSTTGCHVFSTSNDSEWIESESVMLKNYTNHINYRMYINKNDTLVTVRAVMEDDIYDSVSINTVTVTALDGRTLIAGIIKLLIFFVIADLLLFLFMYRQEVLSKLSVQDIGIILVLLTLLFVVELPMTMNHLLKGYDLRFHYYKIYSIAVGLQEGIFPVKIQPEWVNGYGYAVGVFYGDIFLYLPAVLYVLGFSLSAAYKFYVFFINFITIINSYFCFKAIGKHKYWGMTGAAIYSMSLHRLVAAYTRGAVGAFSAMAFLPLVILGIWEIYQTKEPKKSNGWLFLGIGLTGILETHVLGTIMTCTFILLFVLINFRKTFSRDTLVLLGKTGIFTVLLNLFFIVPFLHMSLSTPLRIQTVFRPIYQYSAFVSQLFTNTYNAVGDVREDLVGMYHDMPMTLGPASLIVILGVVFCLLAHKDKKEKSIILKPFLLLMAALWFSTNLFPYRWLQEYLPAVFYVFMKFEFAWRFQAIATALVPVLFILLFSTIKKQISHQNLLIVSGIVALLFVWQGMDYIFQYNDSMIPFEHEADFRDLSVGAVYDGQYLPEGFDETNTNHEITVSDTENTELVLLQSGKLNYEVSITNRSDNENYVEFPLISYKGYHAVSDLGELKITPGEACRLRVIIPAGFNGNVQIRFIEPWFWRLSEFVSLLTFLLILGLKMKRVSWQDNN